MRCYVWVMAGVLAAGAGLGCDDSNELPPEVVRAREQQERERRQAALPASRPAPTTQQLMAEERRPLKLGTFPLVVDAPKSWTVGSLGGSGQIITLSGPATSGEIVIQLVEQGRILPDMAIESTLEAAKREAAAKPYPVNRVDLRAFGPGKLLEQRVLSGTFENGKPPAEIWGDIDTGIKDPRTQGNITTRGVVNPRMLKWNFTLFTPASKDRSLVRGLNFMSLKLSEFEQDREFLEQLMGSLRYQE
jgi:hypothetical protein